MAVAVVVVLVDQFVFVRDVPSSTVLNDIFAAGLVIALAVGASLASCRTVSLVRGAVTRCTALSGVVDNGPCDRNDTAPLPPSILRGHS